MRGYRYVQPLSRGWVHYSRTKGIYVTTKSWGLWLRAKLRLVPRGPS